MVLTSAGEMGMFGFVIKVLVPILLLGSDLMAREWINQTKTTSTGYLISYESDRLYLLEQFDEPVDGLQDRVGRWVYPTASLRDEKLNKILVEGGWVERDQFQAQAGQLAPTFRQAVYRKLGFSPSYMARPQLVLQGFQACQAVDCSPGTANYELH